MTTNNRLIRTAVRSVCSVYTRQIPVDTTNSTHEYKEKRNPESAWIQCLMSKSSITSSAYHSHLEQYTVIAAVTRYHDDACLTNVHTYGMEQLYFVREYKVMFQYCVWIENGRAIIHLDIVTA